MLGQEIVKHFLRRRLKEIGAGNAPRLFLRLDGEQLLHHYLLGDGRLELVVDRVDGIDPPVDEFGDDVICEGATEQELRLRQ